MAEASKILLLLQAEQCKCIPEVLQQRDATQLPSDTSSVR